MPFNLTRSIDSVVYRKLRFLTTTKITIMQTEKVTTADTIINNHAWFSAVPGFVPIPILDILGISAVQRDMVKQLCKFYDSPYSEQKGKAIVMSFTGSILSRIPAYSLRSAVKSIPVVGWALGGLSLSAFAASSTYAVGQVFKEHLDKGGTLHDLNPENFRAFYKKQFEKGRDIFNRNKGGNDSSTTPEDKPEEKED